MGRIALLTPSITTGDAVSNDIFGMYELLTELGFETRIYAEGWSFEAPRVWPSNKIDAFLRKPSDVLIYHYSRGWDFGLELLKTLPCRKIVRYHNVTPPEFAMRFSPEYAMMCEEGRSQLPLIARSGSDLFVSASQYNERELLGEGAPESRSSVVPPFHHIDRLEAVEADRDVIRKYKDGRANILMVGRISPNKGHQLLIEAFAAYHQDYNPNSRLLIVGKAETRLNAYSNLLRGMVKHFQLRDRVVFAGEVSDSALKAFYSVADVFMMTSEHEGFCVPLVEAMSMGVPIVAYGSSAVPDTVGKAGLVWRDKSPYLLAESVNKIITGNGIGQALGELGLRRYEQNFTNERIREDFLKAAGQFLWKELPSSSSVAIRT